MSQDQSNRQPLPQGCEIRQATISDALAIAQLYTMVYGGEIRQVNQRIENELHHVSHGLIQRDLFVAENKGIILGYGRYGRLGRESLLQSKGLIIGWCL